MVAPVYYVTLVSDPTVVIAWGNTLVQTGVGYTDTTMYSVKQGSPPPNATMQPYSNKTPPATDPSATTPTTTPTTTNPITSIPVLGPVLGPILGGLGLNKS